MVDVRLVIASLEKLAGDAGRTGESLRTLADRHHLADVRERAARAYARVTGEAIPAGRPRCPSGVKRRGGVWTVELSKTTIRFAPAAFDVRNGALDREERRSAAGRCAPLIEEDRGSYIAHPLGADCLVGVNQGEFGGWVRVRAPHSNNGPTLLWGKHPKRFVEEGDGSVLVFEGFEYGPKSGGVHRLRRQPDGKSAAERVAELEANPVGWTRDGEGRLLVLVRESLGGVTSGSTCRANDPSYVVLRVQPDGRIEALE